MTINEKLNILEVAVVSGNICLICRKKYGLKIFYIFNQEVYVSQPPERPFQQSNKPKDVVLRLLEPLKNSHRNITFDT